jgi:hypothetical protein
MVPRLQDRCILVLRRTAHSHYRVWARMEGSLVDEDGYLAAYYPGMAWFPEEPEAPSVRGGETGTHPFPEMRRDNPSTKDALDHRLYA